MVRTLAFDAEPPVRTNTTRAASTRSDQNSGRAAVCMPTS
jgi:hypothetical protein